METTLTQAQLTKDILSHATFDGLCHDCLAIHQSPAVTGLLDRLDRTWLMEAFTAHELSHLMFLRWLYESGRVVS